MRSDRRWFGTILPLVALVTLLVAHLWFAGERVAAAGEWLFLSSIVLLGLPHGAVDHVVMAKLARAQLFSRRTALLVLGYLSLVGLVLALWQAAPLGVFVLFIAITWFHWGQGDAWFVGESVGTGAWWQEIVVRGALPMVVPMVAFPGSYAAVAEQFIAAAGADVGALGPVLSSARWWVLAFVAPWFLWLASRYVRGRRWRRLGDVGFLALYFAVVPPLAAIALYFCFWHSGRHLVRLGWWTDRGVLGALRLAVPLTLVSLAMLAGLYLLLPTDDLFAVYLALIAALTVPHVVVVSAMDVRDRALGRLPYG